MKEIERETEAAAGWWKGVSRPGCFPAIAGIPANAKLGDFPAKDLYSRWL